MLFRQESKVMYCSSKRINVGVDHAENHLIVQHQAPHDIIAVNRDPIPRTGDTGHDIDSVDPQHGEILEAQLGAPGGFKDYVYISYGGRDFLRSFDRAAEIADSRVEQ